MLDKKVLDEIKKQILEVSNPDKIIVFGSYIYGTPTKDSDIDIIVVKSKVDSKIEEYYKIRKKLSDINYAFDIIVVSTEEYNFYSSYWPNSVISEADKKGVKLYDKEGV